MSGMSHNRQAGFINSLLIPLVVVGVLLLAALSFGLWAFSSRSTYKNHSDKLVADAVIKAKQDQKSVDDAAYTEAAKSPFKTHVGPEAFGSITVQYPKSWSGYIIESDTNAGTPMNDYFFPDVVPDVTTQSNAYALRVQVVQQSYDQVMLQFTGSAQTGKASVAAYNLPKVPSVVGSRIDGQLTAQKQGSMVVLPLRNVTLEISTESQTFENDFNTKILPNLSFSP